MVYYKISHCDGRITNPEHRIASDVPRFCSKLSEIVWDDLTALTDGLLYTWRLCSYASPKYVFWILGYVLVAGTTIRKCSPPFSKLMSREQQLEGDYRQLHSRLRTHSESISFYGGEMREDAHIQQKFKTLVRHLSSVLHDHWWFGMIQDFLLKYLGATVDLEYLLDRYPPEKEVNWGDELSLGEQQRLSMARLFYHKPKFAILDECTSAVTTDMEERFCTKVRAMGTSCITISHRPTLVAFHDVVLSLDGEGGWSVRYRRIQICYKEDSSSELVIDTMKASQTKRQRDAETVQEAFTTNKKGSGFSKSSAQSYITEVISSSTSMNSTISPSAVPQIKSNLRPLPLRVAAMSKVLVVPSVDMLLTHTDILLFGGKHIFICICNYNFAVLKFYTPATYGFYGTPIDNDIALKVLLAADCLSYEKEVERETAKTADMKEKGADPYDFKQQLPLQLPPSLPLQPPPPLPLQPFTIPCSRLHSPQISDLRSQISTFHPPFFRISDLPLTLLIATSLLHSLTPPSSLSPPTALSCHCYSAFLRLF
ncbi:ABC transporter D family member [Arachis hypogaea]|nr:ABC transporter D family member [Arachis hypogaea]